jgi:hypothetical protein
MTCIVGFLHKDTVYLAGDSAGTDDDFSQHIRKDPKVFQNGPFIFGFTSSFRMGQILMSSKFKPWKQKSDQSDYDYMITDFVDALREAFKESGYLQKREEGDEVGGTFLVGYKGQLYYVEDDFQIGIVYDPYLSVGCGRDLALGSLFTQTKGWELKEDEWNEDNITDMLILSLDAASHFSAGCKPPYNIISISKDDSIYYVNKLKPKPIKKKDKDKED